VFDLGAAAPSAAALIADAVSKIGSIGPTWGEGAKTFKLRHKKTRESSIGSIGCCACPHRDAVAPDTICPVPSIQATARELDMNAPPEIDPINALSFSDVVHWLTNDARDERFIENIFAELCIRLQQAGIPVKRASLHVLINHPQWLGARIVWADGMREAEILRTDHDVMGRSEYIGSPANEIHDGAGEVRENLERDPSPGRKHVVYDEMRAKGLTDYVAWPLYHTLGKRHMVTFATDQRGGFDDTQIAGLLNLLPVLALVSEIRVKNRLAQTLLETYVGSHAGELILAGATRRGSGTTVRAAIMICDLRDFTRISDNWPRDDVIDLLNGYFDAMSEPIAKHGGEILKFIGDGLLAIFPLDKPSACADLLHAVTEARQAMVALNEKNGETGRAPLNYGIGVHVGDVMYGNIGSRTRLDFTVIGPAVNMASRLEALTKQLGKTVLLSRAFADFVKDDFDLERVGEYPVRGFNDPIELFAYYG
jgi:adenylate cyclase